MEVAEMSETEYREFKKDTLRRISLIAQAEEAPIVAYSGKDGWANLVNLDTGKETHCKA